MGSSSWNADAASRATSAVRASVTMATNDSSAFTVSSQSMPAPSVALIVSPRSAWCRSAAGRIQVRASEIIVSASITSCLTHFSTAMW
jgi:hypothetical protein